ncbi:hypothetical protein CMUS01_03016 [Colletotrichum musicola]|uniref:Uncharacterized protein n=1 Tax=Colletotrichum musicola TaxID=2175873 RepID=A0A8H6NTX9_9PEZI|nr:hypothetical protein CMUS01_03016 [Colletotrichum musicola]
MLEASCNKAPSFFNIVAAFASWNLDPSQRAGVHVLQASSSSIATPQTQTPVPAIGLALALAPVAVAVLALLALPPTPLSRSSPELDLTRIFSSKEKSPYKLSLTALLSLNRHGQPPFLRKAGPEKTKTGRPTLRRHPCGSSAFPVRPSRDETTERPAEYQPPFTETLLAPPQESSDRTHTKYGVPAIRAWLRFLEPPPAVLNAARDKKSNRSFPRPSLLPLRVQCRPPEILQRCLLSLISSNLLGACRDFTWSASHDLKSQENPWQE